MAQVLELNIFVIGGCYLSLLDNCGTASKEQKEIIEKLGFADALFGL